MYVRAQQRGGARGLAGKNRIRGLGRIGRLSAARSTSLLRRRLAALGYDDSGLDWTSILTTGITTAGVVAKTAVTPPTYSAVTYPSGATSITSYGASTAGLPGTATGSLESFLTSPLFLIAGMAIFALAIFKR